MNVITILLTSIRPKKKKKLQLHYMLAFKDRYKDVNNIKATISDISEEFSSDKKFYGSLKKCLFYLDNSLLKDYKTALGFIEKDYPDLKSFHKEYIDIAKQQQYFMLTDKGGNNCERT